MILGKPVGRPYGQYRRYDRASEQPSRNRVPPNPNESFGPPGSTGGGRRLRGALDSATRGRCSKLFGLDRFPEKTGFRPPKRSPRRPRALYFHRRDRVRRSSAGRIVRTDPKSIPNTRVGEGRQAGLGAATMFRASPGGATLGVPGFWVNFGLAGADGMPAFCGASIATDPRTKRDQRWGSSRNRHDRLRTSLGKCGGPRPPSARAPRGARLRRTCLAWPRNSTSSTCLRRQRLGGTDDGRAADSMTDWVDFSRAHGGERRQDRRRHALGVAGEIG